jgi:hypothetical protein
MSRFLAEEHPPVSLLEHAAATLLVLRGNELLLLLNRPLLICGAGNTNRQTQQQRSAYSS